MKDVSTYQASKRTYYTVIGLRSTLVGRVSLATSLLIIGYCLIGLGEIT